MLVDTISWFGDPNPIKILSSKSKGYVVPEIEGMPFEVIIKFFPIGARQARRYQE
ncbi:unnamed protein product [Dovyalis caffra]|uniref:Uncharacterized protein n=1 Tax=Dovyalis caffra TaxID=77055 RepID=A0AAV1QW42_9ROSI|nr:unnamed protein product [Dovyalis caffra]